MLRIKDIIKERVNIIFTLTVICTYLSGCVTKYYPDEKFDIDPAFREVFQSVISHDTFSFQNSSGGTKTFVISKVDSVVKNSKGMFINEAPYKLIRICFKEIGRDTLRLLRPNEVYINKDPFTDLNTLSIKFNNLYYSEDNVLPKEVLRSEVNNETIPVNCYRFQTSLTLEQDDDVGVLDLCSKKGFIGFITKSGEVWKIK